MQGAPGFSGPKGAQVRDKCSYNITLSKSVHIFMDIFILFCLQGTLGRPGDRGSQGGQGAKGDNGAPGARGLPGIAGSAVSNKNEWK